MLDLKKILHEDASIIVSGSTGFIGFNFVNFILSNSKIKVYAYREKEINIANNFRLVELKKYKNFSLINNETIKIINKPIKLVINFASYGVDSRQKDTSMMLEGNINFSLKMIDIAKKFNAKYIHTSSCYEYNDSKNKIKEETLPEPKSLYGAFKAATSIIVEHVCLHKKIDFVILYLFGVYGPNESGEKILPDLFNTLTKKNNIELTDGNQIRDYTFITDIVKAYLLIGFNKNKKSKYNVCSSQEISIKDFITKFAQIGNFDSSLLKFGVKKMNENNFKKVIGDNSNISDEFGWQASVSFEEGMQLVIDDFKRKINV